MTDADRIEALEAALRGLLHRLDTEAISFEDDSMRQSLLEIQQARAALEHP